MTTEPVAPAETTCRHHWLLGQPFAGSIAGVCRNCGAARRFPAFLEESDRGYEPEGPSSAEGFTRSTVGGARSTWRALPLEQES